MAHPYDWDDLFKDMDNLQDWLAKKPKWWQFFKRRKWLKQDPRQYWK